MLAAESVRSQEGPQESQSGRYVCLDLLVARFECTPPIHAGSAILAEIWPGGGLLHLDCPIPSECEAILEGPAVKTRARVLGCAKEERGYLVEFSIAEDEPWFPEKYLPPYLLPAPTGEQKAIGSL
jgi:hypothetical protein